MASLTTSYVGGVTTASQNVLFLDDNVLIYPCGHSVVMHNSENNVQLHVLQCSEQTTRVTALALSSAAHGGSKRLLAVAEHGPGRGVVCIREFDGTKRTKRKKRELRSPDGAEFVSVAFSNDGKLLLTQGGAPNWQLTLWSWEKAKVIASVRTTTESTARVNRADFNPFDSSLICASGVGLIKVRKLFFSLMYMSEYFTYLMLFLNDYNIPLGMNQSLYFSCDSMTEYLTNLMF